MATIVYSINFGQNEYQATVQSASTGADIEITVKDNTVVTSREDLLLHIEKIENFITRQPYSPV
jgi:hypothetical protein